MIRYIAYSRSSTIAFHSSLDQGFTNGKNPATENWAIRLAMLYQGFKLIGTFESKVTGFFYGLLLFLVPLNHFISLK